MKAKRGPNTVLVALVRQPADWQLIQNGGAYRIPDALLALFPGDDILINEAIDDAVELGRDGLGMPMFFSSGNEGNVDSIPIWPARYHNTIAVNSTSMCDERKSLTSCDGENWEGNWSKPYTGPVIKYYKDGSVELRGQYSKGLRTGSWTYYHPSGVVKNVKQF